MENAAKILFFFAIFMIAECFQNFKNPNCKILDLWVKIILLEKNIPRNNRFYRRQFLNLIT